MSDARFRRSASGVTSLGLHVVWCPKYRKEVLGGRVVQRPDEMLDEIAAENDWQVVAREVMPDHVHVFVRVRPTDSPAEVADKLKGRTSRLLRAESSWLARRKLWWSKSYLVASVGYVPEEAAGRYIEHKWDDAA